MFDNSTIGEEILSKHNLRKTPFRLALISLFLKHKTSLSPDEVTNHLSTTKDKVTIYRALNSFEKNGLIHRVPDVNDTFRYALCKAECTIEKHIHDHVHFICDTCRDTFCVPEAEIPLVKFPKGFAPEKTHVTSVGYCPECNTKK